MELVLDHRRLRGLLKERGITQRHFAQVARLHESHLSLVLTGRRPPGELTLIKIGSGLDRLGLSLFQEADRGDTGWWTDDAP